MELELLSYTHQVKPTKYHCQTGSGAALKDDEEVLKNGMHENFLTTSAENGGNNSYKTKTNYLGISTHQLKFCLQKRSKPGGLHLCLKN